MPFGTSEQIALLAILAMLGVGVVKYGYDQIMDDVNAKADESVEEELDNLQDAHEETRRVAEAAYASVYGDDARPEDSGFVQRSEARWERLEADIEELQRNVEGLERRQERHQQKTEVVLDALAEEMDVDIMFRGGEPEENGL